MDDDRFLPPGFLNPPIHDDADPADASSPDWVLLDFRAYFANRRNSTTATCKITSGEEIQVTFFPAHPPWVSYFCFYCYGLGPSLFDREPKIIATEANFVLLRFAVGSRNLLIWDANYYYFIYQADGAPDGGPSLEQLPDPRPYYFYDEQVGILSRGSAYTIVALRDDASAYFRGSSVPGEFDVCLLHSEDKVWTTETVSVPLDQQQKSQDKVWTTETVMLLDEQQKSSGELGFRHYTTKVITVGGEGGTMAFVDLKRGILQYDVLFGNPQLRYISLPQQSILGRRYDDNQSTSRDIALVHGCFKFVEVATMMKEASGYPTKYVIGGWVVTTWSMKAISSQDESWSPPLKVQSADVTFDCKLLLPNPLPDDEGNPPLHMERLLIAHPAHSLHDDVVYVMVKAERFHLKTWVMAIDMVCRQVIRIAEFDAVRVLGIRLTYTSSWISQHLKMSPGTKRELKRPKLPLLVPYSKKLGILMEHRACAGAEDEDDRK